MKKGLLFCISLLFCLTACDKIEKISDFMLQTEPFKEYKMKYNKEIEKSILKSEIASRNLNIETTTADVIKLTKIGDYATGTVRIIGTLTEDGFNKVKKMKKYNNIVNDIVSYDCIFETSFKENGQIIWRSDFPYQG